MPARVDERIRGTPLNFRSGSPCGGSVSLGLRVSTVGTEPTGVAGSALLGRDEELEWLSGLLERTAAGQGLPLILSGPAGIGKTTLLQELGRLAGRGGVSVLTARGGELEQDLPFGVVRQLFEPRLATAGSSDHVLLEGAAGLAAAPLGLSDGDGHTGGTPSQENAFAALHGLYWLVANLALSGPLVLAVDDAHWSDLPSARFLAYLAHRIEGMPVLLALARRPVEPAHADPLAAIEREAVAEHLEVAPLGEGAISALLRQDRGEQADQRIVDACAAATRGNPLLVRGFARSLDTAPGASADGEDVAEVVTDAAIARSVMARVRASGPGGLEIARAAAVLGGRATHFAIARMLDLSESELLPVAEHLAREDIFSSELPFQFAHPITRSVVYREMPAGTRAHLHSHAAEVLSASGAKPEEIASHLLLVPPAGNEDVVERLRAASLEALAGGASEAAVRYLERALAEPPPPGLLPQVTFELGDARSRVDHRDGTDEMQAAFREAESPELRAQIALRLAVSLANLDDPATAIDLVSEALNGVDRTSELGRRLEAELITLGLDFAPAAKDAVARMERVATEVDESSAAHRIVLANIAFAGAITGRLDRHAVRETARAALGGEQVHDQASEWTINYACLALMYADEPDEALAAADAAIADARSRGMRARTMSLLCPRSHIAFRRGLLRDAEADALAAMELAGRQLDGSAGAEEEGAREDFPTTITMLGAPVLEREGPEAALRLLRAHAMDGDLPDQLTANLTLVIRGRAKRLAGDHEGALADLTLAGERTQRAGIGSPMGLPWRSESALALAALERGQEAKELVESELEIAERFGAESSVGVSLRALAAVDPANALVHGERAVQALGRSPARYELAQALIEYGMAVRRAGRRSEASDVLRQGLDLAVRCGGEVQAARAREELALAGVRPRRDFLTGVDSLTPGELRVASMATEGLTNRQIAEALFLTMKTVETHLSHVYAKLEISSRKELPAAMG
jgi:DNA-binding CsgD family transcriptional regulator